MPEPLQLLDAANAFPQRTALNISAFAYSGLFLGTAMVAWSGYDSAFAYRQETPEERERRIADERLWAAQREERESARREANDVAERLLRFYLTPEQCTTLDERDYVETLGNETKRRYRIYRGRSMNVECHDAKRRQYSTYCAHPQLDVPDADTMLSQLLMIRGDERRFLGIANKAPSSRDRWGQP